MNRVGTYGSAIPYRPENGGNIAFRTVDPEVKLPESKM